MLVKHSVKLTKKEKKSLSRLSFNELWSKGEEIAVNAGYDPAGYGFQSPVVTKDGYFEWKCFDSCD